MIKSMVGVEVEFLLWNEKGEIIIPPASWDRDGFPVFGEVRAEPGVNVTQTVSNFHFAFSKIAEQLLEGHSIEMVDTETIPLALYKKANREASESKHSKIYNINGINIDEFSDQIIKNGKIQRLRVSCGLHIHFSCNESKSIETWLPRYEKIELPLSVPFAPGAMIGKVAEELVKPVLTLYKKVEDESIEKHEVSASRLNKPAIEYIVKEMDARLFKKYAPKNGTKYRQPGFFEPKPHGFEYRSLPANKNTIENLPEIVKVAFDLLKEINKF